MFKSTETKNPISAYVDHLIHRTERRKALVAPEGIEDISQRELLERMRSLRIKSDEPIFHKEMKLRGEQWELSGIARLAERVDAQYAGRDKILIWIKSEAFGDAETILNTRRLGIVSSIRPGVEDKQLEELWIFSNADRNDIYQRQQVIIRRIV